MSVGLKANVDGSGAIQVGGTDAINLSTGLNATFVQNLNAPNTFGFKNRLINGEMDIDQRNAGASVTPTASAYTLDRWYAGITASSKFSVQQNAGSVTPPAGFTNYLGATSLSAYSVAAGDTFSIQQRVEGFNVADLAWGTASAATVTVSFWVRSSLTGTFGGSIANSAFNRSYPFTYTVAAINTWEQKTVTIAGDTTGTWVTNNGSGMVLYFNLGAGATFSGTAGAWAAAGYTSATGATSVVGTSGATFYVTGVQLEKGTTATSFDYRDYGRELAMCQRYYRKTAATSNSFGEGTIYGYNAGGSTSGFVFPFPVTMRAEPTSTAYGSWTQTNVSATVPNLSSAGNGAYFCYLSPTATGAFNLRTNGVSTNYLDFSAEL